jgi:glycopeptide antibiotics resistance protein
MLAVWTKNTIWEVIVQPNIYIYIIYIYTFKLFEQVKTSKLLAAIPVACNLVVIKVHPEWDKHTFSMSFSTQINRIGHDIIVNQSSLWFNYDYSYLIRQE